MTTELDADRSGWMLRLHRSVLGASLGIFGSSLLFDALSQVRSDQYVYAQGAYSLISIGLVVAVIGVVLLVTQIAGLPSGSADRRAGLIHLAVTDVSLLWFGFAWLYRRSSSMVPTSYGVIVVSGLVVLAVAVSHVVELRGVAPGDEPVASSS